MVRMMEPGPYCIVRDDRCHSYVIPVERKHEWDCMQENGEFQLPPWAYDIGGSPSNIRFEAFTDINDEA